MNCFTFHAGKITPGIGVITDDSYGQVVFLGERGKGKKFKMVSLDHSNPSEVIDGVITKAFPKRINTKTAEGDDIQFVVLAKPFYKFDNGKAFVRVNTSVPNPTKMSNGSWRSIVGRPLVVVTAWGGKTVKNVQNGQFSVFPKWNDDLIIMHDRDAIMVIPEGGVKDETMVIQNQKGIVEASAYCDFIETREGKAVRAA